MIASKPNSRRWLRAKRPHLAPQLARLERLLDQQRHLVEVERLVDVVDTRRASSPRRRSRRSRSAVIRMTSVSGGRSLIVRSTLKPSPSGSLKSSSTRSTSAARSNASAAVPASVIGSPRGRAAPAATSAPAPRRQRRGSRPYSYAQSIPVRNFPQRLRKSSRKQMSTSWKRLPPPPTATSGPGTVLATNGSAP